jgi:hypothetical protein
MRLRSFLAVTTLPALTALGCGSSVPDSIGTTGGGALPDAGKTLDGTTGGLDTGTLVTPDATHHDSGGKLDGAKGAPDATKDSTTGGNDTGSFDSAPLCLNTCSPDFTAVIDCNGNTLTTCAAGTSCDLVTGACNSACQAAADDRKSAGCEYYATSMDTYLDGECFAAFIANTWTSPAHITVDFAGTPLSVGTFAYSPSGSGTSITYTPYDEAAGIPPGEMAILFLAGSTGGGAVNPETPVPCPRQPAMAKAEVYNATGIGSSFHITSDVPVASYQINPYGGGAAAVTGASLLLPVSAWSENYVAVTVSPFDIADPSMNVIASQDNTVVTVTPNVAIVGGGALPAGAAGAPYTFTLNAGQQAQFSQQTDLTGSTISASAPVGFMAGQQCMHAPAGVVACDHGEQMVPPAESLGFEYVGVMFRPRTGGDAGIWHLVGAADGTTLTYSSAVGGPATLNKGQIVDFVTATPFTVASQDSKHPFMMFTYMSGCEWPQLADQSGFGDPDFVLDVPPAQFLNDYVFFADPTYPETDVVVIREMAAGQFEDVTLDCAGVLTGWQTVGNYQWTRVDLDTGNYANVGNCSTGRHAISSAAPFGIQVWGWGTAATGTAAVSYGYPGGMNVQKINRIDMP